MIEGLRRTPLRELDTVERRLRRMLEDLGIAPAPVPAARVYKTEDEFVAELEVPGYDNDQAEDRGPRPTPAHNRRAERSNLRGAEELPTSRVTRRRAARPQAERPNLFLIRPSPRPGRLHQPMHWQSESKHQQPIMLLTAFRPAEIALRLRDAGYCVEAIDAERAWELPPVAHCAALILEVAQIDACAVALWAHLAAEAEAPPVLVWALDAETPERIAALDAGAAGVITGPYAAEELVARIRALLRRHACRALPPAEIGPG